MRFAFSWQHSDDRLASRHLIPRLDPHLRLLRQIEVHARPEPDQPVPLAAGYPLALGEPAYDAPRHVPGHLHAQHALAPVSLEQRRHLFVRQRRVRPARHQEPAGAARNGLHEPGARRAVDVHVQRAQKDAHPHRPPLQKAGLVFFHHRQHAAVARDTTRLGPSGTRRDGLRKNHPVKSTTAPNNDPATVQPNTHAAMPGAAAAARKGSPSRAIGQPRARSAMDQFLVLSTSWSFLSHGIMARNRAPTSSIGCCSPRLSKALYWGRLAWHSSIHSLANRPLWISSRMRFISCLVSSVMMRGPRVTSPYLAVVLIE